MVQPAACQPCFIDSCRKNVSKVYHHIADSRIVKIAKQCIEEFLAMVDKIKNDPNSNGRVLKLFTYMIHGIQAYRGRPDFQATAESRLGTVINVIDLVCLGSDSYALYKSPWKDIKDPKKAPKVILNIACTALFVAADAIGAALWLDSLKIIDLAKISASLGRVPVLGTIVKVGFGTMVNGLVAGAFGFMGIESCIKLSEANAELKKAEKGTDAHKSARAKQIQSIIEIAWSVAEIAKCAFIIAGLASVATFGIIGLLSLSAIAAALGLATFIHYERNKKEIQYEGIRA